MRTIIVTLLGVSSAQSKDMEGIWINDTLQFYLEIKNNVYTRYQYTELSCFRGAAGFLPAVGVIKNNTLDEFYSIIEEDGTLIVSRPQEHVNLMLKPIPQMPRACKGYPIDTSLSNFHIFWHTINEVYNFSHIAKQRWSVLFSEYLPQFMDIDLRLFSSREEEDLFLFESFARMLFEIGDPHLFLLAPKIQKSVYADDKRFEFEPIILDKSNLQVSILSLATALNSTIQWLANGNIALIVNNNFVYIGILSFSNYSASGRFDKEADAALKLAIERIAGAVTKDSNILIDLRWNEGGSIDYANQISALFSPEPRTISHILSDDGSRNPLGFISGGGITPNSLLMLSSKYTASAAEHMLLNLKSVGGLSIGEKTRGAFSPVILKTLPNGWMLGIPPFKVIDNSGSKLPEKIGILPDIHMEWTDQNLKQVFTVKDWQTWLQFYECGFHPD